MHLNQKNMRSNLPLPLHLSLHLSLAIPPMQLLPLPLSLLYLLPTGTPPDREGLGLSRSALEIPPPPMQIQNLLTTKTTLTSPPLPSSSVLGPLLQLTQRIRFKLLPLPDVALAVSCFGVMF